MVDLNPQQFEKFWGKVRNQGGEVQHFAGWHVSDEPFQHDPEHRHEENVGGAWHGDVYTSFEPKFWGYRGDHATEIWSTSHNHSFDPVHMDNRNENIVDSENVRPGRRMSFDDAVKAAKPYDEYYKQWSSPQGFGHQMTSYRDSTDLEEHELNFLKQRGAIHPEEEKSWREHITKRRGWEGPNGEFNGWKS